MFINNTIYRKSKAVCPLCFLLILLFILPLLACPLWGQLRQKKELKQEDYSLWSELHFDKMSPNAKWISYRLSYQSGLDTLIVKSTTDKKSYPFPLGDQSTFIDKNWFACLIDNNLKVLNLTSGKQQTINRVKRYEYSSISNKLLILVEAMQDESMLIIQSPEGNILKKIQGVTDFSVSPSRKEVIYTTSVSNKNAVGILNLQKADHTTWLVLNNKNRFYNFSWQKKGEAVAFFEKIDAFRNQNSVYYYNLEFKKLGQLNPYTETEFPTNTNIVDHQTYKLSISDDAQKVFFAIKSKDNLQEIKEETRVEIWNGNDKWIYPMEQKWGQFQKYPKLALWLPMEHHFKPISTNELPKLMLTGNQEYAILSDPKQYEPQFEFEGPRDFYIMNLTTGVKDILLSKHSGAIYDLLPSPSGKYISYFRENNWWVYNIKSKTHLNVTKNIQTQFKGKVHLLANETTYGNLGWSIDDQDIIVYDQYDLWAIKPDGTAFRRLTAGRELQISFRLADVLNKSNIIMNYDGRITATIDLNKNIFLRANGNDGQIGFFQWKMDSGEKVIVYGHSYLDQFSTNTKKQVFLYKEQKFDRPPRIMFKKSASIEKTIFQSNPQQTKYNWGKAELINYQNSKKLNLKGVLFYPAAYDSLKKYPMIVHIYEKQSQELHRYVNPTWQTEAGFNTTVFTSQGYFVFYPDIVHETENPGISAADCVIAATSKIIESGMVNPDKIGLIGHSFGGYETAFIITQTGLFKTAVAGAPVTDLHSFYHTVGWDNGRPEMWRFQSEQWKMGKSPYENPQPYHRNSTIVWADKIKTPLLLWTGKKDQQVDWHQSIELYLTMRRLQKENILLLYPQEGHSILNQKNQQDLFEKIQQWFAYYLKDEQPPPWISQGIK